MGKKKALRKKIVFFFFLKFGVTIDAKGYADNVSMQGK